MKTKIASALTHRQILDAMGSETTDAEAEAMRELLRTDEREISAIPDHEWWELVDRAVKIAAAIRSIPPPRIMKTKLEIERDGHVSFIRCKKGHDGDTRYLSDAGLYVCQGCGHARNFNDVFTEQQMLLAKAAAQRAAAVGKIIERDGTGMARVLYADVERQLEVLDWERWAKKVCEDFRIPFDNHTVGLRCAITQWMAEKQHAKK